MARFRCIKCGEPPDGFLFEADLPTCPRCYASGPLHIVQLVDVHFMVMDAKGPIQGAQGRQFIACQRKREYVILHTMDTFGAATDDPSVVTCRSCRGTKEWQQAAPRPEHCPAGGPAGAAAEDHCDRLLRVR